MKPFILLVISIFFYQQIFATNQVPDYVIYKGDTFSISSYPLEQYHQVNEHKQSPPCFSTACWRGYSAIWEIINDSLFLNKISPCHSDCENMTYWESIFEAIQRKNGVATWYTGKITLQKGKYYNDFNLFEEEEEIDFLNGVVKQTTLISNLDKIFSRKVIETSDTLLYYFNKDINLKRGKTTNGFDCFDEYLLTYDKNGSIRQVQLLSLFNDTLNYRDSIILSKRNEQCSTRLKSSLEPLSLNYINPHSDFRIIITLYYHDKLKISECFNYRGKLSRQDNWSKDYREE